MIYNGTNVTETIWFAPLHDQDDIHCIELIKADDEAIFYVTSCCNDEWIWAFYMDGVSNYEMVKHTIMDAALECVDMYHLLGELDAIFATDFEDIVAYDECECDGSCCEHCDHRDCLN
jgi:hypothetical protein